LFSDTYYFLIKKSTKFFLIKDIHSKQIKNKTMMTIGKLMKRLRKKVEKTSPYTVSPETVSFKFRFKMQYFGWKTISKR